MTLGRIVAKRGQVLIVGRLGTLWHYPATGLPMTPRDAFELQYAAREYGQPLDRLEAAYTAAAMANLQPQKEAR